MRLRRYGGAVAVLALLALGAAPARAQVSQVVTGRGISIGDRLVLHIGTGIEFLYDDNIFYVDRDKTSGWVFHLTPTIALSTRPTLRDGQPHKIDFAIGGGVDYGEFITSNKQISKHRTIGGNASANVTIFQVGVVGADFYDNYSRVSQVPYNEGTAYNLNQDLNELGMRLHFRPGGGRLTINLNYGFGVDIWEERLLKPFNLHYHRVQLDTRWKFLPKTALYLMAEYNPYVYFDPGAYQHPNSNAFRLQLGLTGLITPKLSTELHVGYGNPFYQTGPSPNTGVGGLSFTWKPIAITNLSLGYEHNFVNSLISSYYDSDQVSFSINQMIWRFVGVAKLQYTNMRFQGALPSQGFLPAAGRKDNQILFTLRFDYPIKQFMAISLDYSLAWNGSNASIDYGTFGLFPVTYLKNQVGLRFTINY